MKLRELLDLLWYSFKSLFAGDINEWMKELSKPQTWSTILYIVFIIGLYKRSFKLMLVVVPLIIYVYIIRQRLDGSYRHEKFKKNVLEGKDTYMTQDYYYSYLKAVRAKKTLPLTYEGFIKMKLQEFLKKQ